jgi:hypothetical protein
MPIAVDNMLPVLSLALGLGATDNISLTGLCDSCGALNTGYTLFHQWIYATYPHLVAEYREFNDKNPFEPIKLLGAIRHPSDFNETDYGLLTAIIRYKTPYTATDGKPILLSIALGNDVSTNTIFGLPTLDSLQLTWDFSTNTATSKCCGNTFTIQRRGSKRGLPDNVHFDTNEFERIMAASEISAATATTDSPQTRNNTVTFSIDVKDEFSGASLIKRQLHPAM